MSGPSRGPLDVLVVGWYPAADDPIAGRFIADQAAALLATGRVRPSIASFEPFALRGDLPLREAAVEEWLAVVRGAAREARAFVPRGATAPVGVPVARLGTPVGGTRVAGRTHEAIHRAEVLAALLDGRRGSFDLVHAHVGFPEGAAAARVARARGRPLVLTEHATYLDRLFADAEIRAAYLEGARSAARIVAVSSILAERIGREFPELVDRLVVIPNTVDVDAFRPVPASERDPNELLWVGYRREVKGLAVLLEASRLVRAERPGTRLRLVGRSTTDEEEAGWHRLAGELGIADAVSFEPPADRAGVAAAMERAALFVHPSRKETMGIVAVEALAAGLPVVAVDSGGVTEVLGRDPEAVGALVPRQDPALLAAAILETLDRRERFDPLHLRDHVVGRYGAAAVAERLTDLYDEVLGRGSAWSGTTARTTPDGPVAGEGEGQAPAPVGVPLRSDVRSPSVVLVGFERPVVDRVLVSFGDRALGEVVIATAGGVVPGHPDAVLLPPERLGDLAAAMALSGRARGRGIAGLAAAPVRWVLRTVRRRLLLGRLVPALEATVGAAVAQAARSGDGSDDPVPVVCFGGFDVLATARLRRSGRVAVAPGGPRWLADARAADEPDDQAPSRSR